MGKQATQNSIKQKVSPHMRITFFFLLIFLLNTNTLRAESYKLTDAKHRQFLKENTEYALANIMLNTTWVYIEKSLPLQEFEIARLEQQLWIKEERDALASTFPNSLKKEEAYTLATIYNLHRLSAFIAIKPINASYYNETKNARFTIKIVDNIAHINIKSIAKGKPFSRKAQGKVISSWMPLQSEEGQDIYLLTTKKGAIILNTAQLNINPVDKSDMFSGYYTRIP